MTQEMIFGTAGGLGLFLFGMIQMSEGLKKAAERRPDVGCETAGIN